MYDSTTARWLTTDPLGLAPDSNPYRYVGNEPTDATDPTGLQESPVTLSFERVGGTEVELKNNMFKVGEGTGTVKVFKNSTLKYGDKEFPGRMVLEFKTEGEKCTSAYWLQFKYRYLIEKDTGKEYRGIYGQNKEGNTKAFQEYGEKGRALDCLSMKKPIFDGATRRMEFESSMADRPTIYERERFSESGFVAEAFLGKRSRRMSLIGYDF